MSNATAKPDSEVNGNYSGGSVSAANGGYGSAGITTSGGMTSTGGTTGMSSGTGSQ